MELGGKITTKITIRKILFRRDVTLLGGSIMAWRPQPRSKKKNWMYKTSVWQAYCTYNQINDYEKRE